MTRHKRQRRYMLVRSTRGGEVIMWSIGVFSTPKAAHAFAADWRMRGYRLARLMIHKRIFSCK